MLFPAGTAAGGVNELITKGACKTPVPVAKTTCGLPDPLSEMVMEPKLAIPALGVKVTAITQLLFGCNGAPVHLSVSEKSPLAMMLEKTRGVVPLLVTITSCGELDVPTGCVPKARLEVDNVTVDVLPVKLTMWGLPGALSLIVSDAFRIPWAVGVNVTVSVQVAPTFREPIGQVVVSAKSPGSFPARVMLEME